MMDALKCLCAVLYFLAVFVGVPFAIAGTAALLVAWLGPNWGAVAAGVLCTTEFIGALCFVLWEDNPIPDWITS